VRRSKPLQRKTGLRSDPEKRRAFVQRGRASSARSLGISAREAAAGLARAGRAARTISPASDAQRLAVDGMVCLGCGKAASSGRAIDPAHIWPRGRGGCDDSLCVVPLCRTFTGGCHRLFDEGELDLLAIIVRTEAWEQWRAHAQHALEHCTPNELVERLTGARTQWSDVTRLERDYPDNQEAPS
jgi:hypothetical protein